MKREQWDEITRRYKADGVEALSKRDIEDLLKDAERIQFPATYVVDEKKVGFEEYANYLQSKNDELGRRMRLLVQASAKMGVSIEALRIHLEKIVGSVDAALKEVSKS